jgi:MFS transporter, DHA1 family, multidrug resistance protein
MAEQKNNFFLILMLGMLSTVSPFSIDMYLPAFNQMAGDLHATVFQMPLTLSSYFVGLSIGQLFYGPFLDRFGRRQPLFIGLALYVLASFGCWRATSIEVLIAMRFFQAIGGCAASVASMAMVRDFFPARESAKIFSLLILILGLSPLLAPTVGGFVVNAFGWRAVFLILMLIVSLILTVIYFFLPEGHQPDTSVILRPRPIVQNFVAIVKNPQFATFAFAGALSFAGLFVYVAGSPIIFMDIFKVTANQYSAIFAFLSIGFIGSSQLNVILSKKFRSEQIFQWSLTGQCLLTIVFFIGSYFDWIGLLATIVIFFLYLACLGIASPNATALALTPFSKNAGSASALIGFLQIGTGAIASAGVSIFEFKTELPAAILIMVSCLGAYAIFLIGRKNIVFEIEANEADLQVFTH